MSAPGNDPPEEDFTQDDAPVRVRSSPVVPYDPAEDRERARRYVAYALIALLAAEALGAVIALIAGVALESLRTVLDVIFAPTATLAGAVTAFYFAADRDK